MSGRAIPGSRSAATTWASSPSTSFGGRRFAPPAVVADFDTYNDREAVTADPRRPARAYIAWVKRSGLFGESGVAMFSRTTDGGRTWSPQQVVHTPAAGTLPDPTLIEVMPDGDLLYVFMLANGTSVLGLPELVPFEVMAMRSDDLGRTWSTPQEIGVIENPVAPHDPRTGAEVRASPVLDTGVGPNGTAYVVWNEIFSETRSAIFYACSGNGGRTWSEPGSLARVRTQAFIPNVAVTRDGVIGVTWDDFRGDRSGDRKLTTRVWLAHSHNGGRSWRRQPLGGPFDMLTAPETASTEVAGRFVGEYQGLAAAGRSFVAAFAEGKAIGRWAPRPVRGPSDVMFARMAPRRR